MRLIPPETLRTLYAKSDAHGAWHTVAHAALLVAGGALIQMGRGEWWLPLAFVLQGLFVVSLFGAMHEAVHDSAFRTRWLNRALARLAGLGILFDATYYRRFHFEHHRYAQDPLRDPELLTAPPPRTRAEYWLRATALPYWWTRISNLVDLSRGRFEKLPFIPVTAHAEITRSVRWTAAALAALFFGSLAVGSDILLWCWLVPLVLGLPFLRLYLLTEHTGCSEDDNGLTNTRTTISVWPVRFLMWNLPYHAEHHLYPSIPFHRLPDTHRWLGAHLRHVAPGYVSTNRSLYPSRRA